MRDVLGGATVIDSTQAALVWEPRRIVPSYAVPATDVRGELAPAEATAVAAGSPGQAGVQMPGLFSRPVLDPSVPFAVHTAAGQVVDVTASGQRRPGARVRSADPGLAGHVVL